MSTKAKLQQALTDFNQSLAQMEGIAQDERLRVEGAFHGLFAAVGQLPEPAPEPIAAEPATVAEQVADPDVPAEQLVEDHSKAELVAAAAEQGVDVKSADTKQDIAENLTDAAAQDAQA